MRLRSLFAGLLPLLTLALGWQLGAQFERNQLWSSTTEADSAYSGGVASGTLVTDPEREVNLTLLWNVWDLLLDHYIDQNALQVEPMLYGAVAGLVDGIGDPYTEFMSPTENQDFQDSMQGKLQGIGAELTIRDGLVVIVAPLKGSPAEQAGLLPEDIILEVNGEETADLSLNEVVSKVRGPQGTTVTLLILRRDEEQTFTITRDEIRVPSVESEIKETESGAVGYISVNQFGEETKREVEAALESLKDADIRGLILDERYNGGGYLERAVELTSMFLREGKVVTVRRRGAEDEAHFVNGRVIMPDIPLVVLINEGSASASEILAGALQDHSRATIIGKKSYGKGTIQELFDLPNGASLRVTTAEWLTPDGRNLGHEGVMPDIDVDRTPEDREQKKDPQLEEALRHLLSN